MHKKMQLCNSGSANNVSRKINITFNIEHGDTPITPSAFDFLPAHLSSILVYTNYRSYTLPKMTQNGSGDICIFLLLMPFINTSDLKFSEDSSFVHMRLKTSNATETENKRCAPPMTSQVSSTHISYHSKTTIVQECGMMHF